MAAGWTRISSWTRICGAAVEAVLADRARAYLVAAARVAELASERGGLLVEERLAGDAMGSDAATRRCLGRQCGRRRPTRPTPSGATPTGGVRRLLARSRVAA